MSRIRKFVENIDSGRKKFARETAEKSDKQYRYLHAESEGLDSERYRDYFRELRERDKARRKGFFYRVTGITPLTYTVVPPSSPPYMQKRAEDRFFGMTDEEFEGFMKAAERYPFRAENMRLQRNGGSSVELLFLNYWPIVLFFLLETGLILCFTLPASAGAWIPITGIICAAVLLWLLKWARVKKDLGLKFFCPFTIGFLCSSLTSFEEDDDESEDAAAANANAK